MSNTATSVFFKAWGTLLACQLFADARNLPFAIAAIKAKLPDGNTVGTIIRERAHIGDEECRQIIATYARIRSHDDHAHIGPFLATWNAWRMSMLPTIVEQHKTRKTPWTRLTSILHR